MHIAPFLGASRSLDTVTQLKGIESIAPWRTAEGKSFPTETPVPVVGTRCLKLICGQDGDDALTRYSQSWISA